MFLAETGILLGSSPGSAPRGRPAGPGLPGALQLAGYGQGVPRGVDQVRRHRLSEVETLGRGAAEPKQVQQDVVGSLHVARRRQHVVACVAMLSQRF